MLLICAECGKEFERKNIGKGKKTFCCRQHAASFNNRNVTRNPPKLRICKHCKKEFYNKGKKTPSEYCPACREQKVWTFKKREKKISPLESVKKTYKKRKKMAIDYMGGKCQICGYSKCEGALSFHHIDPSKKEFTLSGRCLSWSRMKTELDKCILVCLNCHAEIHNHILNIPFD